MSIKSSSKISPPLLLLLLTFFLCTPHLPAAERISLDGQWQFRLDPRKQGEAQGWTKELPSDTETVRVPHTWGIGEHAEYLGTAWYFKSFDLPPGLGAKHLEVHFGATFYRSRVWLNGVELGGHEGGHTAYFFDVTPYLKPLNLLTVEVNNEPTDQSIPGWALKLRDSENPWYDWWPYGGIVRSVWLSASDAALVRRQQIRTKVASEVATVTDTVFLENHSPKPVRAKLVLKAWLPGGGPAAATAEQELSLAPGVQEQPLKLEITHPRLWDFDHPNVYRMEADLLDAQGNPLDSLTDNFGVRTIEIRDRHLHLNGEPVRLTGMTRHEDSPWEGLAETRGTMKHDYDDMKNLQVTLTRPVHYPQNPYILDYCDRHGILLIPEIPMWQFSEAQMSDPKVIALAKRMMTEMIEQDYNHPSIFAWSACNESATDTPGGRAYFKTMYDLIKQLDPDRYVSYADDRIAFVQNPAENSGSLADFIMWNEYFGTWHGPASLLPSVMEKIRRDYPDKMVIISEMGAVSFFEPNSKAGDRLRRQVFRDTFDKVNRQDWIAGIIMWCYQDYKSHRNLWPGETSGYVEMGIVDENRQRRPSYHLWKKLNSPAHVQIEWQYNPNRQPVGFHATIERRGPDEIPSYALRDYRVSWEVRDNDNNKLAGGEKALPEIGPPQRLEASWPVSSSKSLRLTLQLIRPTGFVAAEKTIKWWDPRSGGLNIGEMKSQGPPVPE